VATPITRGSRTQVWEVVIRDDAQQIVATGRVRTLVLDADSQVAGGDLSIKRA
jgi:acyl-coenzyme A thioesterase PaaI-like protein